MNQGDGRVVMNINELAAATGIHRQTIVKRLAGIDPIEGSHCKLKLYDVKDAFPAIYSPALAASLREPSQMEPADRKAWYQSENERVRLIGRLRELVPAEEVEKEMRLLMRIICQSLSQWPVKLQQERGWDNEKITEVRLLIEEITQVLKSAC